MMAACHRRPAMDFAAIEAIMPTQPDSALVLLDTLHTDPNDFTAKDRAHYYLLLTEAMDKCYLTHTTDSLITIAKNYYENANEAIISKEDFENVQKIKREKTTFFSGYRDNRSFFTQKVRCRKCGWVFRKVNGVDYELWACSRKGLSIDVCRSPKLRKEELESAFVRMFNSLQENRKRVLDDTIMLLQSLKTKCNMSNNELAEIDAELAALATQNKAYAEMVAAGILDQVTYSEKADRIKGKIAELRSRRLKVLNADEEERSIEGLRELKRKLETMPHSITEFDEVLFSEIVEVIFVEQDGAIVFKVNGDLELKIRRY